MKIDLEHYQYKIEEIILDNKKESAKDIMGLIMRLPEQYLICNGMCAELLPVDAFNNSKSFSNRNGKYTICKRCLKRLNQGK